MNSLFNALITSKMRIRILMRLFLNPSQSSRYLENWNGTKLKQMGSLLTTVMMTMMHMVTGASPWCPRLQRFVNCPVNWTGTMTNVR